MKSLFLIFICVSLLSARNVNIAFVCASDSFQTSKGERIRLLGLRCPSVYDPYGKETFDYVKGLLTGKSVQLQFDGETERKDSAGVLFSYLYLICDTCPGASFSDDGYNQNTISIRAPLIDICELLLKNGMARMDSSQSFGKHIFFNYLEKNARRQGVGLWKSLKPDQTQLPSQPQSSSKLPLLTPAGDSKQK